MGNSLGAKKTTKIMKIDGETIKLKTPVTAEQVLRDFPGHVVLDFESVKHYGARAKPLEAKQRLEAKRLYFVIEPVKEEFPPRRVRSGIHVSAKQRLESLMLARRSSSDLSILKPAGGWTTAKEEGGSVRRVKVRVSKAELEKLVKEGATEAEASQKIAALFMAKQKQQDHDTPSDQPTASVSAARGAKSHLKRVRFMAQREGGSEITVA